MKDIIKVLGIRPIKLNTDRYNCFKCGTEFEVSMCSTYKVREKEDLFNELLEALITDTISTAIFLESKPNLTFQDEAIAKHIARIELIEKSTGKTWDNIKEALDD